ncbi:hypothetical protein MMC28_006787 [Mycoblastus sanguinarius]|nr:hypothetical protein [Mycoblastus sanguinarius]
MPDGSWIREGPPIMMVSLDSARLFYPREKLVACNADHSQIAKLERGENGIYPNIKWAVQQVLPDVTELSRLQVPFDSSGENGESLRGSSFDAQDPQYQREREKARAANWRVSQVPGHYNPARKPSLPAGPLPIGEVLSSENAANLAKESVLDEDLASAIKAGKAERVRDLVLESYDINCRDKYGQTPLLLAASLRQEEVLKEVLKLGADTLAVDSIGSTTLHIISIPKSGQRPLTKSVMDQLLHHKPPLEVKTPDGNTPLLTSARFGATQAAKSLIHQGASVSVTTEHGSTPLHRALEYGQEEIAELLVASGAPFEARENTEEKFTPLHRAVLNNETSANMIRILLQAEANREAASAASKRTPLMLAMFRNNEACVDELLKAGANINAMQKDGYRPLHVATHHGKLSFTEMLLQHGADLEVTTNDLNMTPLMVAIASGNDPCVKVMLESGADIETEHFCGWRPLHLATRLGRLEVIETLLVHGANPCARTPAESLMKTGLEAWKTPSSLGIDKTVTDSRKKQILRMLKDAEDSWKNNDSKVGL